MNKIAQRMSKLRKLHEKVSPKGKLEEFFQPRFKEVMESLRQGDDSIRSIVAGEQLGDGDPGKYAISMKDLLKKTKSDFNRREYMSAISGFSKFHDKLREIAKVLNELNLNVDKVHHQFLFQDLDEEHKPHLMDLENRWKAASDARQLELRKEAGIMDIWHNLTNDRGISLRKWEKQYPEKTKELKKSLITLQQEGDKTLAAILANLKELAALRASRNPEEYMKKATSRSGIMGSYNNFDKLFQKAYSGTIQRFISDMKSFEGSQKVPTKDKKEMGDQSVPVESEKMTIKTDIGPDIKTDVSAPPTAKAPSHLSMPPAPGKPGDTEPVTVRTGPQSSMDDPYLPYSQTTPAPAPGSPISVNKTPVPSGSESISVRPTPSAREHGNAFLDARQTVAPTPSARQHGNAFLDARQTQVPAGSGVVPNQNFSSVPAPLPSMTPEAFEQEGGHNLARVMRGETPTMISNTHANFFDSLQKMGNESPLLLASYISKYAKKIQSTDPATSIQLLNIVKRIKG